MNKYKKDFEKAGYRAKMFPYNPFTYASILMYLEDYRKHNDAMYRYKREMQDYDVLIFNLGTLVLLRFHHPELMKQYFSHEREWCYKKYEKRLKFLDPLFGEGLARSEG